MGHIQTEWLIYFYESDDHKYADWLQFLKKGFKVISIVSRKDEDCLKKLYVEISKNCKIIVCDVTTILFYSMFLKKKVRVLLKNKNELFFSDTKNQKRSHARAAFSSCGGTRRSHL